MLRRLVLLQHLLLAVLVVVGLARGLAAGAPAGPLVTGTGALVLWYAVGAWRAGLRAGTEWPPETVARPSGAARRPAGPAGRWLGAGGWWLLGLVALWLLTVAVSPELVWVAFSLWLLAGHLLPTVPAVALSAAVLAVVVGRAGHADGWTTAAVVGPAIGAVFALALSRGLHQVVQDSLERQRLVTSLVAAQEETETLQAQLVEAQRAAGAQGERTRLSRDIHDTLAQGFSSILLLARAGGATGDPAARLRLLGQIETSAADHLEEARRVVGALAPAPLESGLTDALRRLAAELQEQTGVRGEVRVEGDVAALPVPVEVALLRTAQSALANVRRHSGAGAVTVTLTEAGDSVRLDVVDDGVGFDLAAVRGRPLDAAGGGYGLRASRERLVELGGGLEVESAPGRGTAVSAHLPRSTSGAVR